MGPEEFNAKVEKRMGFEEGKHPRASDGKFGKGGGRGEPKGGSATGGPNKDHYKINYNGKDVHLKKDADGKWMFETKEHANYGYASKDEAYADAKKSVDGELK